MVVVLHQLGNHGPANFRRYPVRFRKFTPTCDTQDLGRCTRQQIINSYDNALLYTDFLLSQAIGMLTTQTTHDAAMIYVSDHGESLGENGIYLHGLPYQIAPKEQTHVPMVMWLPENFKRSFNLNNQCLKEKSNESINHDYLFHTVFGMLDISTRLYRREYDITAGCSLS